MNDQSVEITTYSLAAAGPQRPPREAATRSLSLLRVGVLLVDGRRELCLVRNISAGGTSLRCYSPLAEGTRLSVELRQGEPIGGTVTWVEGGLAGVAFDRPVDVCALLIPAGGGPPPRMPRIEVDSIAWVRQGAAPVRTRTLNVSQGGICVESQSPLCVGGQAVVTLPGIAPAQARVTWNCGRIFGIRFNGPLLLADLVEWLRKRQSEQQRSACA